ncbi:MAG: TraB/GumN family protein [Proteobacteria bacterium]|nr:TraB/GumN family protein [Pseudomonadota bacterium]
MYNKPARVMGFFAAVLFTALIFSNANSEDRRLCLWSFENDGTRIYLLGSMHAMKPDMYPLAAPIMEAFEAADKVVFEVDLTRLNAFEMNQVMRQKGMYKEPESIRNDLKPDTFSLLTDYLKANHMVLDQVERMKPWYLMLTIGQRELSHLGFEAELGIDRYLQQLALEKEKEILQLETFSEQIDILSGDPISLQELSLRASLEERQTIAQDLEDLLDAWKNGDADKMLELTLQSTARYPELKQQMDTLIYQRNIKMAYKIREYANTKGTYLVVVGALHMGGEEGIIKLLQDSYEVTQLTY